MEGTKAVHLAKGGALCAIAPTLLSMMGLEQPRDMHGQSLIQQDAARV
jgi:2,3-bisphosphoglycerate-independent phosphoglycerate mutase